MKKYKFNGKIALFAIEGFAVSATDLYIEAKKWLECNDEYKLYLVVNKSGNINYFVKYEVSGNTFDYEEILSAKPRNRVAKEIKAEVESIMNNLLKKGIIYED